MRKSLLSVAAVQLLIAQASIATISVDYTVNQHWLNQELLGVNMMKAGGNYDWLWDESTDTVRSRITDLCGGSYIRYPGGSSGFNHWEDQVADTYKDNWIVDPSALGTYEDWQWMNLVEYSNTLKHTGAKAMVGVNVESYKEAPSATMLTNLMNDVRYHLVPTVKTEWKTLYYIGNEAYNNWGQTNLGAYTWLYNQMAKNLKVWDPNCDVALSSGPKYNANYESMLSNVKANGAPVDWLDIHEYWNLTSWGSASWNEWTSQIGLEQNGVTYKQIIDQYRGALENKFPNAKIIIGEWNVGPHIDAGDSLSGYKHGLMIAEIFMEIMKSGADAACYWPSIWPEDLKFSDRVLFEPGNNYSPRPAYTFLKEFSYAIPGRLVTAGPSGSAATVVVAVKKNSTTLHIYVLNKRANDFTDTISLDTSFGETSATKVTLKAPGGDLKSDSIDWDSKGITVRNGSYTITFPAWSLTRLTLTK